MDWLILVGFACVPLVALLGILLGLLWSSERCPVSKVCLVARVENWSLASLAGMLATLVTVLLIGIFATETGYVNSTGHASGMAMFLTLLFAFYKFGFHELVQMSREAAWRIHATLGLMTLVMGLAHLVLVFQKLGAEVVFGHVPSVFGLVSLLLMLLGSLPAKFLIYDYFKLLHFLSFIGLLFTIYHMIEAAVRHRNLITIVTAVVNCAVLLAYVGQRSYVWAFARKAVVRKSEVIAEKDGEHIFLYLSVPGFSFKVGQWTRLWIPSLSSVAHPFTLIPANEPGADVALFIKVAGAFTQRLAARLREGHLERLQISLQGPFGRPAVAAVPPVVYVCGGVGITPCLAAQGLSNGRGRLYWALRSEALLRRVMERLELDELSCVKLKGRQAEADESITAWLEKVAKQQASEGQWNGTIFVCGPKSMSDEVRKAVKASRMSGVKWHVHTEEFRFLPKFCRPNGVDGTIPTKAEGNLSRQEV
mmetsp:Transcript_42795/g.93080  ORF Transcript_42795/g.93080 Transcript_42795/m.93080 type:complete len:479 (-) Transcript_42795:189-1625(-)